MLKYKSLKIILIILILLCIICLISCEKEDLYRSRIFKPSIFGYAFLDDKENHEGILIRLIQTGDSTYTNVSGRYQFSQIAPDTYTVVATYEKYEPAFAITYFTGIHNYEVQDLQLSRLSCTPRDSFPYGYPIDVYFCKDISFYEMTNYSYIGDSLYIVAGEFSLPPLREIKENSVFDTYDILLISSLGDKEIKHVDRLLGSIPEVWIFGYIIDTDASVRPFQYNDIVEVEPTGGWVIAMYQSYWFGWYVCKSIEMNPSP